MPLTVSLSPHRTNLWNIPLQIQGPVFKLGIVSAGFRLVEALSYIKLGGPLLKSYTRRSHKGVYQNRTWGHHKEIKNIYMPFIEVLKAKQILNFVRLLQIVRPLALACLAYA